MTSTMSTIPYQMVLKFGSTKSKSTADKVKVRRSRNGCFNCEYF
jgi:hypothetical protein